MSQKPARRAYSAEELMALRRSASDETALEIQKKAGDGAIRGEHMIPMSSQAGTEHVVSEFRHILIRTLGIILFYPSPLIILHVPASGMATTPVSPYSQLFGHHENYALRLVEGTPTPPCRFTRHRRRSTYLLSLTENDVAHVLRGSRNGTTRSASSALPGDPYRRPPHATAALLPTPVLGEIDPNNQRMRPIPNVAGASPSSSIKKKRAEQILKQHGSPPGIRVTAGGRIVPSEQSPLCSPRYGYSAVQKNGGLVKFAPGYPPPPKTFSNYAKSLPNGWVLQDPAGKLVQVVDGRFLPVQEINGIPQLLITAPNVTSMAWNQFLEANDEQNADAVPPKEVTLSEISENELSIPTAAEQIAALEKHYQKMESERRSLDKTEVLKRNELTGTAYTQLIQKRRELIERQDEVRRSIKALKESQTTGVHQSANPGPKSGTEAQTGIPSMTAPSSFLGPAQWPMDSSLAASRMPIMIPGSIDGVPVLIPRYFSGTGVSPFVMPHLMGTAASLSTPAMTLSSATGTSSDIHNVQYGPIGVGHSSENDKDGHALHSATGALRSGLNPMSPIYEPNNSKLNTPEKKRPSLLAQGNKSSAARASPHMVPGEAAATVNSQGEQSTQQSSEASYTTADFFPNNPRDHSLYKHSYPLPDHQITQVSQNSHPPQHSGSDEALAQPEMERHNPNWNPTIPDQAFEKPPSEVDAGGNKPESKQVACQESSLMTQPDTTDEKDGYQAGLLRAPIGADRSTRWVDGYIAGLKAAQLSATETAHVKPVVRLPSAQSQRQPESGPRSTKSGSPEPTATKIPRSKVVLPELKDLINAPSNEQAILSPDPEGPSVDSIQGRFLGSWSKENSKADADAVPLHTDKVFDDQKHATFAQPPSIKVDHKTDVSDFAQTRAEPAELTADHRTFSSQTQPVKERQGSFFQRAYGAHRVLSTPALEWRSAPTVAHMTGLASGYFAQFDGTSSKPASKVLPNSIATDNKVQVAAPKFKEASMPQESSPSPDKTSTSSSPKKPVSPAKAKFAAIAGKAGIKVRTDRPSSKESNELEPMSPQERRRWRSVWKKRNAGTD